MANGVEKYRGWNLLWTNPSPNSNFAPQTLNLDGVGNYEEYAVIYKSIPTASLELTSYFLKPNGTFMLYGFVLYSLRRTDCTMTEDTFYIGKGSAWENNTYAEDNKYYIPLRIYAR